MLTTRRKQVQISLSELTTRLAHDEKATLLVPHELHSRNCQSQHYVLDLSEVLLLLYTISASVFLADEVPADCRYHKQSL